MRIHVWAPSFREFGGGITAFSREVALGLRSLGHQLTLFGKHDSAGDWEGLPLHGAKTIPQRLRTPGFAALLLNGSQRERPQALLLTHPNFAPVAEIARQLTGVPFTVVVHGVDVHEHLPWHTKSALKRASCVLAVSNWTAARVQQFAGVAPQSINVFPNTFDDTRFFPSHGDIGELRRAHGLEPSERVLLTVSRLDAVERYKGYDTLIRALSTIRTEIANVRLIVVGDGTDKARAEKLAYEAGVSDAVTFTGFLSDGQLVDHYRLADAFALPSTGEGFGIVFLEAMGCGTPVVGGNRDGSTDALANGTLGSLVDPRDPADVARGITLLLNGAGPEWWFDRSRLRDAVVEKFGRKAFRERLARHFPRPNDPI